MNKSRICYVKANQRYNLARFYTLFPFLNPPVRKTFANQISGSPCGSFTVTTSPSLFPRMH